MRLELYNPSIFKDTFEAIGHIIDECKLNFTNQGLSINALDKSHITFIMLEFKYTLFDEYECSNPESIIIDTNQLMQILKRCGNQDMLRMETTDSNLILTFTGEASKQFSIRLIDQEYETPIPPSIDYPLSLEVPSVLIKDSLDDCSLFNENLRLIIDEDYLHITSSSDTGLFGDTHIQYLHGENISQVVRSGYSIEKLKDIFRASKLSKTCILNIGNDLPLGVTFNLYSNDGSISFLLAPRLEEV